MCTKCPKMVHGDEVLRIAQSVAFAPLMSRGGGGICTSPTITETPTGWSSGVSIYLPFMSNGVWTSDVCPEEILEPSWCREPPIPLWCGCAAIRVPLDHVERLRDDEPAHGYSTRVRSMHEQVHGCHSVGQIYYARLDEAEEIGHTVWVEF